MATVTNSTLLSAASLGNWSKLQSLVEKGANLSSEAAIKAFSLAAAANSVEVLQSFLVRGLDVDSWGVKKALLTAASTGDLEVLRCLVSHRADLTSWAAKQSLILAVEKEQLEVMHFFLRSGTLELTPEMGDLVMEVAASKNDVHILQLLLDKAAHFATHAGQAALSSAARCRSWEALHFLVLAGVQLDTSAGQVALLAAAGSNNCFILKVLEEGGLDTSSELSKLTLSNARYRQHFYKRLRRKRLEGCLESAVKFGKVALRASCRAEERSFLKAVTAQVFPRPPPTPLGSTLGDSADGLQDTTAEAVGIVLEPSFSAELQLPSEVSDLPSVLAEAPPTVLKEDVRRYVDHLIFSALKSGTSIDAARDATDRATSLTPTTGTPEPRDVKSYVDLRIAAGRGHQEKVAQLLHRRTPDVPSELAEGVPSALHLAAQNGHREVVEALLSAGHDSNEKVLGFTPLHDAAQNGHLEIVRLLLSSGGANGAALHIAARRGHVEVVQALLTARALPNSLDCGYSALHDASYAGHPKVVQLLLEHRASVQQRAPDGATCVHLAVLGSSLETLQLLLEAQGDPRDAIGDQQITPIHLAVSGGHVQMLRSMVSQKPSWLRDER